MAELLVSRNIALIPSSPQLQSPTVNLGALTSAITVSLRRPTTAVPVTSWSATGTVRVTMVFIVDGVEYRCVGKASGGIRVGKSGQEMGVYSLVFRPTVLFGDRARQYILTATPDPEGYYLDVPLTRLGELGTTVQGYLLLERLSGRIETELLLAATTEEPAPTIPKHKNSVAFDAATDAQEVSGDGILSLSHTASGSNRAAFIGVASSDGSGGKNGSVTYGGVSATELWDSRVGSLYHTTAGYRYLAPATSATTVTSTLTAATDEHTLGVISMTGVDQTTPVGNTQKSGSTTGNATVTATGVNADDLVVDHLVTDATSITIGADQTLRNTETITGHHMRMSTQGGASGGVMSWTTSSFEFLSGWELGAAVFKTAAAAASSRQSLLMMGVGR